MRKLGMGLLALLALLLPLALLSGCNGDNDNEVNQSATLSGLQVVDPVTTSAFGTGTVNINSDRNRITASVTATNFTSTVTGVDIHYGRPGEIGPVLFTLFDADTDGSFPGTVTRTFTSADLATQPLGSPISNFSSAVNAIINGNAYFNVHTVNFPDGEIRGQIGNERFLASLNGNNIVPNAVNTTGTGSAIVLIPPDRDSIGAYVIANNLTSPVEAIEIRYGAASQNGPLLFTVFDTGVDGVFDGSFATTLTSADFATPAPGATITSFSQAINAIRDGNTYFLVTTVDNPTGEIRGQILEPLTSTH